MKVNKNWKENEVTYSDLNEGDFFLCEDNLYFITNIDDDIIYDFEDECFKYWFDLYSYDTPVKKINASRISINIEAG